MKNAMYLFYSPLYIYAIKKIMNVFYCIYHAVTEYYAKTIIYHTANLISKSKKF
jgi:hypothetical protein